MAVELAGNRLLTPIFGNTLYTWTGLISVVLVAIALGDYLGGWLVDRDPSFRGLGWLFLLAAVSTGLIQPLLEWRRPWAESLDVVAGPIWTSLLLFSIPACLLAAVSPFTIRLLSKTLDDRKIGLSAGVVGMLATLGSFVGTLATGLYLIPLAGLKAIFIGCAAALTVIGLIAAFLMRRDAPAVPVILALLAAGTAFLTLRVSPALPDGVVSQVSSFYHDIRVIDRTLSEGRTGRFLQLDTTGEGAQIVETGELLFDYQKYWELSRVFVPHLRSALFIGGGGFGMPEHLSAAFPQSNVTVVELDPAVIETGKQFFRLNEFSAVETVASDARRFLRRDTAHYDLIFGDAYNGMHSVPSHLASREFFQLAAGRLQPDGIYMMNVISAFQGPKAKFFQAVQATLEQVFPHVLYFAVANPVTAKVQNIIIVAAHHDLQPALAAGRETADASVRALLDHQIHPEVPAGQAILTDNRNLSEYLIAEQIREDRRSR